MPYFNASKHGLKKITVFLQSLSISLLSSTLLWLEGLKLFPISSLKEYSVILTRLAAALAA
jgi:hypothetical protein